MLSLLKYLLPSSQPPISPFSNLLCAIEHYCTFDRKYLLSNSPKICLWSSPVRGWCCLSTLPSMFATALALLAVWICSLRKCWVPFQMQPSKPTWGVLLRMTGAVQGRGWCCKPPQCSCIFVPVHGWPFLKCGVAASQVRAVNSPFTRGKSSLTLVLACFRTGSVFRELMVCLQRVNLLSVESGLGYLCVQFITT